MTDAQSLYDRDFIAWAEQQAAALREAAVHGRTNRPLDWKNLAEAVESPDASERRELHSQIQRIIRHLLKLEYSPAVTSRRGWHETIGDARSAIELVLETSPSLRNEIDAAAGAELPRAARGAIRDPEKHREIDPAAASSLRTVRYTAEQVIGDWFPPEPNACAMADAYRQLE